MPNSTKKGKAYFVGFMLADGWIFPMEDQQTQVGILQKGQSGKKILKTFVEHFDWDTQPYKKVVDGVNYWRIQIYSDKWANFWADYNVIPSKTADAKAPQKYKNSSDFWRGVVDGDGTIGYRKSCPRVRLKMGSEVVVKQFHSYCSFLPTNASVRKVNKTTWVAGFHGNYVEKLLLKLYENSLPFALERKYKQAKSYAQFNS